ncbi:MAG: hypothetical protein ACRD3S_03825 [Terracidiphilus sp.]
MKRWPTMVASISGAILGYLCVFYVGMAFGLNTSLTAKASAIVFVVCPFTVLIFLLGPWTWWFVPILNATLYGGAAFTISKWRVAHKRTRQITN